MNRGRVLKRVTFGSNSTNLTSPSVEKSFLSDLRSKPSKQKYFARPRAESSSKCCGEVYQTRIRDPRR